MLIPVSETHTTQGPEPVLRCEIMHDGRDLLNLGENLKTYSWQLESALKPIQPKETPPVKEVDDGNKSKPETPRRSVKNK